MQDKCFLKLGSTKKEVIEKTMVDFYVNDYLSNLNIDTASTEMNTKEIKRIISTINRINIRGRCKRSCFLYPTKFVETSFIMETSSKEVKEIVEETLSNANRAQAINMLRTDNFNLRGTGVFDMESMYDLLTKMMIANIPTVLSKKYWIAKADLSLSNKSNFLIFMISGNITESYGFVSDLSNVMAAGFSLDVDKTELKNELSKVIIENIKLYDSIGSVKKAGFDSVSDTKTHNYKELTIGEKSAYVKFTQNKSKNNELASSLLFTKAIPALTVDSEWNFGERKVRVYLGDESWTAGWYGDYLRVVKRTTVHPSVVGKMLVNKKKIYKYEHFIISKSTSIMTNDLSAVDSSKANSFDNDSKYTEDTRVIIGNVKFDSEFFLHDGAICAKFKTIIVPFCSFIRKSDVIKDKYCNMVRLKVRDEYYRRNFEQIDAKSIGSKVKRVGIAIKGLTLNADSEDFTIFNSQISTLKDPDKVEDTVVEQTIEGKALGDSILADIMNFDMTLEYENEENEVAEERAFNFDEIKLNRIFDPNTSMYTKFYFDTEMKAEYRAYETLSDLSGFVAVYESNTVRLKAEPFKSKFPMVRGLSDSKMREIVLSFLV